MEPVDNFWSTYAAIIRQNNSHTLRGLDQILLSQLPLFKEAML